MDLQPLAKAVARAESVMCEGRDYTGLSLGQLLRCWPQEILSGRVAGKAKAKTPSGEVIKAYGKFCKAASELVEAVHHLPGPQLQPEFARLSVGRSPMRRTATKQLPSLSFQSLPAAAALVPFSDCTGDPRALAPPAGGPFQSSAASFPGSADSAFCCPQQSPSGGPIISPPFPLQPSLVNVPIIPQQATHVTGVQDVQPFVPVRPTAAQHCMHGLAQAAQSVGIPSHSLMRNFGFGTTSGPATALQLHLHQQPVQHWSKWWWILSVVVTFIAPRIVFRLLSLLVQRLFTSGLGAAWRVASAAGDEAAFAAGFFEDVVGICLTDAQVTPAPSPEVLTAVQRTASAAAIAATNTLVEQHSTLDLDPVVFAKTVEKTVSAAVHAAQAAAPMPSPAPPSAGWQAPNWVVFAFGLVAAGLHQRTAR